MYKKKIAFLTATRADYGKLKSLIVETQKLKNFKTYVLVAGMHNLNFYGNTIKEIKKDKIKNLIKFKTQLNHSEKPSEVFVKTTEVFNSHFKNTNYDLVIIHGDRIEPLSVAITCNLNGIKIAHIEGGELSGNIDDSIRHAITKLSHIHLVTNKVAKKRVIQMGESKKSIFIVGSPDIDLLKSKRLPDLKSALKRYNISFSNYSIAILHPITTISNKEQKAKARIFFEVLKKSNLNYIIIKPNNDYGNEFILNEIKLIKQKNIKVFPSVRFEYFLTFLKFSNFIIGNSISGIMEAPYYGIPCINIGDRQKNRIKNSNQKNVSYNKVKLIKLINYFSKKKRYKIRLSFGNGDCKLKFIKLLKDKNFWNIKTQKYFVERKLYINEIFR
jgi:UDP-N-acetylglucosamine 2-epimerase (hydrolysing)